MTSPLDLLFFMAITLAPPGTHHVTVAAATENYSWDRGDKVDDVTARSLDWMAGDPKQALVSNQFLPDHVSRAERAIAEAPHRDTSSNFILRFDSAHQLEKNDLGYVYVVRPGGANQKFYSFRYE